VLARGLAVSSTFTRSIRQDRGEKPAMYAGGSRREEADAAAPVASAYDRDDAAAPVASAYDRDDTVALARSAHDREARVLAAPLDPAGRCRVDLSANGDACVLDDRARSRDHEGNACVRCRR
jgi:hypothetical protein